MGRSVMERPAPSSGVFYHRLSNRHYRIAPASMRRHQLGAQGQELNVVEQSIDLAIGSGNHAITYASRTPEGRLLELPISWYAESKGYQMSPGYDKPDHLDFRREIAPDCLFCHSATATPAPIDCRRCHGDAAAHLRKPGRGTILNPARLSAARQLDICLQCHLETGSGGFTDSIRLPGREPFSFKPGEALTGYKSYFERADRTDRFEINHSGYGLLQSACFRESGGKLTCTTCHDPHSAKSRAAEACAGCHKSEHTARAGDCVPCHMPKRRTEDAVHVVMTDHRIRRLPLADALGPRREDHKAYEGGIEAFLPTAALALGRAYHLAAQTRTAAAYRALPPSALNLANLGEALLRENSPAAAKPVLERALKLDPKQVTALNALAVWNGMRDRADEALRLLDRARAANPAHPLTWINLGVAYEALGQADKAREAYREAIRHQPDSLEARRRLAAVQ